MSGTDSLIAELRGHLEHGISSEAIEAAADAIATLTAERDALRDALAPPTMTMLADSGRPEWQQILDLFKRYGQEAPFPRLRDELVVMLVWARYGEDAARALAKGRVQMSEREEECGNCRFWMKRSDHTGEMGGGYCRRLPPLFPSRLRLWQITGTDADIEPSNDHLNDAWPNVHQQSWCGEFQVRAALEVRL